MGAAPVRGGPCSVAERSLRPSWQSCSARRLPSRGTGVPPVLARRGTGVPPVLARRGTGVPPVLARRGTGVPPVLSSSPHRGTRFLRYFHECLALGAAANAAGGSSACTFTSRVEQNSLEARSERPGWGMGVDGRTNEAGQAGRLSHGMRNAGPPGGQQPCRTGLPSRPSLTRTCLRSAIHGFAGRLRQLSEHGPPRTSRAER